MKAPAIHRMVTSVLELLPVILILASNAACGQVVEAWVQRYGNAAGSDDRARSLVIDGEGNVIVAGYSDDRASGGQDLLVMKYSGTGTALWTNRYNGPGNGNDLATALAVSSNGNVFVTGYSRGSTSADDYITIAYSAAGAALWTNRYNGPGNSTDEANAVAVDGNGIIYVTGRSTGTNSPWPQECATIAYSGTGLALWTNRCDGSSGEPDKLNELAVSDYGKVFVTTSNFATIAYSSAGLPLWTNRFHGRGEATAIAVDQSGDVVVTGYSFYGGRTKFTTIKYSATGVGLWTNYYNVATNSGNAPAAIAVGDDGRVYVTGNSGLYNSDYATVAYSSAGDALWTNRFAGPGNGEDYVRAVAVDHNGNVFVAGDAHVNGYGYNDFFTIAYSSSGAALWTNRLDGYVYGFTQARGIAVDDLGNVFVGGDAPGIGGNDFITVAYSGAGTDLWTNRHGLPGNTTDLANAAVVDIDGNVFVTGYSLGAGWDYATIKYSPAGIALWTNRYNPRHDSSENANQLVVDTDGDIIIAGYQKGILNDYEYLTIKYSSAGEPLWTNSYGGTGGDRVTAVAVDSAGNVFVTGESSGNTTAADFATIAYSKAGVPLWTNRYSAIPDFVSDSASDLAVDVNGNVFVTGSSSGADGPADYATIAYSGSGLPLWTNRYGIGWDYATAMAVDGNGNVIVAGYSAASLNSPDYATVAYSGTGVPLWTNRYNGPANATDQATAVATDSAGNVFVTGFSAGTGSSDDYATVAYSSAGVGLWTNRYNGSANGADQAVAVSVDSGGNVYVTGSSMSVGGELDIVTIKYSGTGAALWIGRYNGPANGDDKPLGKSSLAIGPDGAVYVVGASDGEYAVYLYGGAVFDYVTIKYVNTLPQTPLHIKKVASQVVLSWANEALGLQSASAATGPFGDVPGATSPFTNTITGQQRFFRLKAN